MGASIQHAIAWVLIVCILEGVRAGAAMEIDLERMPNPDKIPILLALLIGIFASIFLLLGAR